MKKLKLFPKIFIYTFFVMLLITISAHGFLYFLAPQMSLSVSQFAEIDMVIESTVHTEAMIRGAILRALPFSLIGCAIISAGCSFIFSKVMVKPIKQISDMTGRMEKMEREARCPINSLDEIGMLAAGINHLYSGLLKTIEQLEEETKRVSEAEKSKLDFLRAASHELKTPVTALNAILENMLLGIGKYKDRDTYLRECQKITVQLASMLKEILSASRLDFSQMKKEAEQFELSECLEEICEPYQLIAKAKQIIFKVNVLQQCTVCTSKKGLKKILSNILLNAVSYTESGHQVFVELYENRICIVNECEPVPKEKIKKLFEPFYRPDFARNRSDGGNGLGLYIVSAMSGALELSYTFEAADDGKGMKFVLFFS